MHNVHDIKLIVVKIYLYLKCNVRWGIRNTNFKVINQHKNDMCHMQSLKMDFYFSALSSFDFVFNHVATLHLEHKSHVS